MTPPLFLVSGPPASGKTTLCGALLARFEQGFHLPVDDLRGWVVRGMADSVPWTERTERQFRLAEAAAFDVARRYHEAGFTVAIDHCRNPARLDEAAKGAKGAKVVKILLVPDVGTNLERSHARTNKPFDPHLLDDTIRFTNDRYRRDVEDDWLVIDNSALSVERTVERILAATPPSEGTATPSDSGTR